ncbi:MAG: T9SS type A sorting domain-containing protein, partial [Bacteroidota bacterium]
ATSIDDYFELSASYIYPHPNRGNFHIHWEAMAQKQLNLKILSLQGQELKHYKIRLDAEGKSPEIKATLSPGYYVLMLEGTAKEQKLKLQIFR